MYAGRRKVLAGALGSTALLAACGGAGGATGAGETLPKPAAGPIELRVTTDTSIQNLPGWQNAAKGYEQKYPTRKVNIEHLTSSSGTSAAS